MDRVFSNSFCEMTGLKLVELSKKEDADIKKELPYIAAEFRSGLITLGIRKRRLKKDKEETTPPKPKGKR